MKNFIKISFIILFCIFVNLQSANAVNYPKLTGRVVDEYNLLDLETKKQLARISYDEEKRSGNQIVIVTVKSLQGQSVEDYAMNLGNFWGIGQKSKDNGVIILVAPNERKVRIAVGYGLQPPLTDVVAKEIIDTAMVPYFKKGDFKSGILNGMNNVTLVLNGGEIKSSNSKKDEELPTWLMILLFPYILIRKIFGFGGGSFRGGGGSFGRGGGSGGW